MIVWRYTQTNNNTCDDNTYKKHMYNHEKQHRQHCCRKKLQSYISCIGIFYNLKVAGYDIIPITAQHKAK